MRHDKGSQVIAFTKSAKARSSQRKGANFEACLEHYHQLLEAQGRAAIFKVPTPLAIRSVGADGLITGRKSAPVWVDYAGCLAGGQAVAIEAKVTSGHRWAPSGLRAAQLERLRQVDALGGLALVLVWSSHYGSLTVIKASELREGQGHDLGASLVQGYGWLDYLQGTTPTQARLF